MSDPEFTFLVGRRASGKTFQLMRAINYYADHPELCQCVHVLDKNGELARKRSKLHPDCAVVENEAGYHSAIAMRNEELPRIVLWQDNAAHMYRCAIEQGGCAVVIDEAWKNISGPTWTAPQELQDIVLRGRHLVAADGEEYGTHLLIATQYPKNVHHSIYEQARTIMVSKLLGENARSWVKEYVGKEKLFEADDLELHEFRIIEGPKPPWFKEERHNDGRQEKRTVVETRDPVAVEERLEGDERASSDASSGARVGQRLPPGSQVAS